MEAVLWAALLAMFGLLCWSARVTRRLERKNQKLRKDYKELQYTAVSSLLDASRALLWDPAAHENFMVRFVHLPGDTKDEKLHFLRKYAAGVCEERAAELSKEPT